MTALSFIWIVLLLIVVCIIAGILLMRVRGKRIHLPRVWAVAAIAVIVCVGATVGFLGIYSHAEPEALACMNGSDTVTVERDGKTIRFDGPGESVAIIFYPGGKVEAEAYAPLLLMLAESGADCFMMEMPFRLAFLRQNAADDVIGHYDYDAFIMMGHSLGGVIASGYAAAHPEQIDGIVMLAAYPIKQMPEGMKYLSLLGDRDGVIKRSNYEKGRAYWPKDAAEMVIEGGNHAQFGCYGRQKGDGEALISADEQQRAAAERIIEWIREM